MVGASVTWAGEGVAIPSGASNTPSMDIGGTKAPALNGVNEQHPWHAHGGPFWVMAWGAGDFPDDVAAAAVMQSPPPLKDTVTLILPTTRSEIERALKTLKVWTLVEGFRGKSGDAQAVIRAVEAVADFANANRGLVEEVDVNPLLVLKDGAVAVDALIKMRKP